MTDEHSLSGEKKFVEPLTALPKHANSLHEIRINNSAIRVEPGRYRVYIPSPYQVNPSQPSTSRYLGTSSTASRRPTKFIGDGQLLDKPIIPSGSFLKDAELLTPLHPKKRYFTEDDEEIIEDLGSPKKTVRLMKRFGSQFKEMEPGKDEVITHIPEEDAEHIEEDVVEHAEEAEHSEHAEQEQEEHQTEYTEETVEVIEGEQEQEGPYEGGYSHNSMYIRPPIGLGNVQLIKQLRGENNYLKDQLELSCYRIKQLEQLLLDRNTRLRSLLAENVQLGVKVRKLTQEIGEEAANEILKPTIQRKHK